MLREYSKAIILIVVLVLVQNMDITLKKLRNSSNEAPTSFAQMQKAPLGSWYIIRNVHSNMCLTWAANTFVKQTPCNPNQLNELWKVKSAEGKEGDWVKISDINGQFLDYSNGEYRIASENKSGSQNFFAEERDSAYTLKNESGKKCIAPSNLNDGSLIKQIRCCGAKENLWKFEKVDFNPSGQSNRVTVTKPVAPIAPVPKTNGNYPLNSPINIRDKKSGRCLTAMRIQGNRFILANCDPNNMDQIFYVKPHEGEFNRIFSNNFNLVFDLNGMGAQDANFYHNWPINNYDAQHWRMPIVKEGRYFKIINKATGKCVDNSSSNVIDQHVCFENINQLFHFTHASDPQYNQLARATAEPNKTGLVAVNTPVFIKDKRSGRCLSAMMIQGQRYHLQYCNPNNNDQKFIVKPFRDGWFKIHAFNQNLVFDLNGNAGHDGNYYHNWPINHTNAQHFRFQTVDNGQYVKIINMNGKAVTSYHGPDIDQRANNGNNNQLFYFVR